MAIRLLLTVMLVASCSKTGLTTDSGLQQDAAGQASTGADGLTVARDLVAAEANLGCAATFAGQCDDCAFPVDWSSAQDPSGWCRLYKVFPPTSLTLCPDPNGYNRAVVSYNTGGEMGIVDRLFFLYDSTTGVFVQQQSQPWPVEEGSCVLGLAGRSLQWSGACEALGTSLDSVCSKALPDAS